MNKTLYTLVLLTCYFPNNYTKLVVGDPNATPGTTFSFNVGFTAFDEKSDHSPARWWTATNDPAISGLPDNTKKYGLSFIVQAASYVQPTYSITAFPMTNDGSATIYSVSGANVVATSVPNPLWGGVFSLFDVSFQKPMFTLTSTPNLLYSVHNIEHYEQTSTKPNITELLVHDFGAGQEIHAIRGSVENIYTAYALGAFGATDSNIALFKRVLAQGTDGAKPQPFLKNLATLPITVSTDALKGGIDQPDIASFGPSVSIDIGFRGFYLGLQATAAVGGVAVGITQIGSSITNSAYTLSLYPIASTSVLTAGIDTVISASSGNTVRITRSTAMLASTNLPYLIVARDAGTGPETIYAVPLTSAGTIADFSSIKTTFGSMQPIFTSRYFDSGISDVQQINPANPAIINQIRVGSASTLPIDAGNTISQVYAVGDSVYAVIGGQYTATQFPGTYKSQAIFAPEGYIIGWSSWTRVLGSDKQMNYSFVDNKTLTGLYVAAQTPSATPSFNSIYQTTFDTSSNLAPFLTVAQGAPDFLQGLFDFNQTTPGFNNELSLMIGTALGKITIGQTGANNGTAFGVQTMTSTDVLTFTEPEINKDAALIAAEIAHNGANHFIFAGGSSGVWVLSDDTTGVTWTGTLASIAGLNAGQTWKKIGDFSFVKKLVWDSTYLYVLTSTHLYRINLDPTKFTANATTPLDAATVITARNLDKNTYLLDLIMDNGYGLLGTTSGLYILTNGSMQKIVIPQGLPAISKLIAIAPNQNPQRSFKTLSNLYVLNNTFGTQQARLHRFAIQDGIIQHLPDTIAAQPGSTTQGIPSPFITFDNYISSYFTDGSWNIANSYFSGVNQPRESTATPFVQQIYAGVRSGLSSSQSIMPALTAYAPLNFVRTGPNILEMIRETTSGAVIAAGAFEAHTNA